MFAAAGGLCANPVVKKAASEKTDYVAPTGFASLYLFAACGIAWIIILAVKAQNSGWEWGETSAMSVYDNDNKAFANILISDCKALVDTALYWGFAVGAIGMRWAIADLRFAPVLWVASVATPVWVSFYVA